MYDTRKPCSKRHEIFSVDVLILLVLAMAIVSCRTRGKASDSGVMALGLQSSLGEQCSRMFPNSDEDRFECINSDADLESVIACEKAFDYMPGPQPEHLDCIIAKRSRDHIEHCTRSFDGPSIHGRLSCITTQTDPKIVSACQRLFRRHDTQRQYFCWEHAKDVDHIERCIDEFRSDFDRLDCIEGVEAIECTDDFYDDFDDGCQR